MLRMENLLLTKCMSIVLDPAINSKPTLSLNVYQVCCVMCLSQSTARCAQ